MDIVNRSPDEVKEREYETTGYTGGTDLPEEVRHKITPDGKPELNADIHAGSTGISEINEAMEEGADIKPND